MSPLRITALIDGPIALPHGPLALDALLTWSVAQRLGLPPPRCASDCVRLELPVQREPSDRFWLCSFSVHQFECHEVHWLNKRAPIEQYQALAIGKLKRTQITAGADKSYRLPLEIGHLVDDSMTWWCLGEHEQIADLLGAVHHLGKKRAHGFGRVAKWRVEPCDPWGDGFPVVRYGKPLRPLPPDWPGLVDPTLAYSTVDAPYWDHAKEELCAVPL